MTFFAWYLFFSLAYLLKKEIKKIDKNIEMGAWWGGGGGLAKMK